MKKTSATPLQKEAKPSKEYLEIRVPKLSFENTKITGYLVFTLIVFSFLLGMLTNKVLYLERLNASGNASQTTDNPAPTQTPLPAVVNVKTGHLPILGNADAKVTIVEFSDFQCPFCERYYTDTSKKIYDTYIKTGKAKLYYRHFPLNEIHPNAQKAAEASECANEQGKFWEYHNLLFENQTTWSALTDTGAIDNFVDLAEQLDLETNQFRFCLENDKYQKTVKDDTTAGSDAQVDGTPTFFINGNRLIGAQPFAEFEKLIQQELKK